jgi:hypothetical protein
MDTGRPKASVTSRVKLVRAVECTSRRFCRVASGASSISCGNPSAVIPRSRNGCGHVFIREFWLGCRRITRFSCNPVLARMTSPFACLSPRWPGFDPKPVSVRFILDKVALREDFPALFPVIIITHMLNVRSSPILKTLAICNVK